MFLKSIKFLLMIEGTFLDEGLLEALGVRTPTQRFGEFQSNTPTSLTCANRLRCLMGVSKDWVPYFGSPYSKDHRVFGSTLGPLVYGNSYMTGFHRFEVWAPNFVSSMFG